MSLETNTHYHPDISDQEFDAVWEKAKQVGILDINDILHDPQGFVNLLGYALKYRDGHWPCGIVIDPAKTYVIGEWQRPADDGGTVTHFVTMSGRGTDRDDVVYDPIEGGSRTVREGSCVSLRLFDLVA